MKFSNVVGFIKNNPVVVGILGILFVVNLVVIQSAVMRQTNSDLKAAGGNYISTVTGTTSGSFDVTFCTDIISSGTWKATFWIETKGGTNLTANPVPVFYYPGPAACQTAKSVQANISGLTSLDLCNGLVARVFWQRDGQFYSQNYSFKSECAKLTPTVPASTNTPTPSPTSSPTPSPVNTSTPTPSPTTVPDTQRQIHIDSPRTSSTATTGTATAGNIGITATAGNLRTGDTVWFYIRSATGPVCGIKATTGSTPTQFITTCTNVAAGDYDLYAEVHDSNYYAVGSDSIKLTVNAVGGPVATNTPSPTPTTGLTTCSGFVTKLLTSSGSCGSVGQNRTVTVDNTSRSTHSSVLQTNTSCSTSLFTLNSNTDNPADNYDVNVSGTSIYGAVSRQGLHLTKDTTTNTCYLTVNLTNPTPIPTATPTSAPVTVVLTTDKSDNRYYIGDSVRLHAKVRGLAMSQYKSTGAVIFTDYSRNILNNGACSFNRPTTSGVTEYDFYCTLPTSLTSTFAIGTRSYDVVVYKEGVTSSVGTASINVSFLTPTNTSTPVPTVPVTLTVSSGRSDNTFTLGEGTRFSARVTGLQLNEYEKVVFRRFSYEHCSQKPLSGTGIVLDFNCDIYFEGISTPATFTYTIDVYKKATPNPVLVATKDLIITIKSPCYDLSGNVIPCTTLTATPSSTGESQVNPMALAGAAALVIIFAGIYAFFSLR